MKASTADLSENETVVNFKEKFYGEYDTVKAEIDKLSAKANEYKDSPELQNVIASTKIKLEDWKRVAMTKYDELNKEYHFDEKIDTLIAKLDKTKEDLNKS